MGLFVFTVCNFSHSVLAFLLYYVFTLFTLFICIYSIMYLMNTIFDFNEIQFINLFLCN